MLYCGVTSLLLRRVMYENFFLDADGTIFDNLSDITDAVAEGIDKYGDPNFKKLEKEQIARNLGNWALTFTLVGIDDELGIECKNDIYNQIDKNTSRTKLFDGAYEFLDALSSRGNIVIASNCRRETLEANITTTCIGKFITEIVCADSVKLPKPSPEMLHEGRRLLGGVPLEKCVMIGDSYNDVHAAHKARMSSILLIHPENEIYGKDWEQKTTEIVMEDAVVAHGYQQALGYLFS